MSEKLIETGTHSEVERSETQMAREAEVEKLRRQYGFKNFDYVPLEQLVGNFLNSEYVSEERLDDRLWFMCYITPHLGRLSFREIDFMIRYHNIIVEHNEDVSRNSWPPFLTWDDLKNQFVE